MNQTTLTLALLTVLSAFPVSAQTAYSVIDLTPAHPAAAAASVAGADAGGWVSSSLNGAAPRAALWNEAGTVDLHPGLLGGAAGGIAARSMVTGVAEGVQVGYGAGAATGNASVPLLWRGSAASAQRLPVPFTTTTGQAMATDGQQAVGFATALAEDGSIRGYRAILWDLVTGAAVDLGDGGRSGQAVGVGGGEQVGFVVKTLATAALWRGSDRSLVSLHPRGAVTSVANATDGVRQVGYAGYDIRVRREAVKGNKDARFNYATVWTGTAASALNIHPYTAADGSTIFAQSYALSVSGPRIAGYAVVATKSGTTADQHAVVWDENYIATDLNATLPPGFIGSVAYSVDAEGQVAGVAYAADGRRHAVVWAPVLAPQ